MTEFHFTKKDFKIDWFSGTGPGGQHRNKSNNCCRITHIETGISASCQESRSASRNKEQAFRVLAARLINYYESMSKSKKETSTGVVRTYNKHRNEVVDHESGLKLPYKQVVDKNDLSEMIESRRMAMILKEIE